MPTLDSMDCTVDEEAETWEEIDARFDELHDHYVTRGHGYEVAIRKPWVPPERDEHGRIVETEAMKEAMAELLRNKGKKTKKKFPTESGRSVVKRVPLNRMVPDMVREHKSMLRSDIIERVLKVQPERSIGTIRTAVYACWKKGMFNVTPEGKKDVRVDWIESHE